MLTTFALVLACAIVLSVSVAAIADETNGEWFFSGNDFEKLDIDWSSGDATDDGYFAQIMLTELWGYDITIDGMFGKGSQNILYEAANQISEVVTDEDDLGDLAGKVIFYGLMRYGTDQLNPESSNNEYDSYADPSLLPCDFIPFPDNNGWKDKTKQADISLNAAVVEYGGDILAYYFEYKRGGNDTVYFTVTGAEKNGSKEYTFAGKRITRPGIALTLNDHSAAETMDAPVEIMPDESLTIDYEVSDGTDGKLSILVYDRNNTVVDKELDEPASDSKEFRFTALGNRRKKVSGTECILYIDTIYTIKLELRSADGSKSLAMAEGRFILKEEVPSPSEDAEAEASPDITHETSPKVPEESPKESPEESSKVSPEPTLNNVPVTASVTASGRTPRNTATPEPTPEPSFNPPEPSKDEIVIEASMKTTGEAVLAFTVTSKETLEGEENKMTEYGLLDDKGEPQESVEIHAGEQVLGTARVEYDIGSLPGVVTVEFEPGGRIEGTGEATLRGTDANGKYSDVLIVIEKRAIPASNLQISINNVTWRGEEYQIDKAEGEVKVKGMAEGEFDGFLFTFTEQNAGNVENSENNTETPADEYTIDPSELKAGIKYLLEVRVNEYGANENALSAKALFSLKPERVKNLLLKMKDEDTAETAEEEVAVPKDGQAEFAFSADGDIRSFTLNISREKADAVDDGDDDYSRRYVFIHDPDNEKFTLDEYYENGKDADIKDNGMMRFWEYDCCISAHELEPGYIYTAELTADGYDGLPVAPVTRRFYLVPDSIGNLEIRIGDEVVNGQEKKISENTEVTWSADGCASYSAAWAVDGEKIDNKGFENQDKYSDTIYFEKLAFDKAYTLTITANPYYGGEPISQSVTVIRKERPVTEFSVSVKGAEPDDNGVYPVTSVNGTELKFFTGDADLREDTPFTLMEGTNPELVKEEDGKWYLKIDKMTKGKEYAAGFTAHGRDGSSKDAMLRVRLDGIGYYGVLPGLRNLHPAALVLLFLMLTGGFVTLLIFLVRKPKAVTTDDIFSGESIKSIRSADDRPSSGERTMRR